MSSSTRVRICKSVFCKLRGADGRAHLVQCPTLILWGEGDPVVSPADAQFFLAHIANSRLVLLENAGHLPHEERAEDVNRLIRAFVAEL